ncbi:fibrinogen-related protein 3-2 [Plakobranchus ocellatus]|uniref:Fibrinogen-related protein 3-2 n=1 Tax=Plakobranchus ocellatus TaxID=259542 RepID=A0AAV3Z9A3_9GAST|nr:fibrinogen-related protein 3-2 [Plakobranchus ocellatus]
MEKVLSLIFLMGIISGGNGLQLSLNRHVSATNEKRAACGVLTCEESGTYQTGSTITKMSVFKHKQSGPVTSDKPERGNLMASVTLEQPLITRESDGVKIDGRLEAGRASLRLELFTKEDCSAEFTCEVRMLDSQEKESINTYHLLQHRDQGANQVDESVATQAGSLQVLLLFQQLDTKFAMMGSSLESKIGSVENRLEDKIASLYDDMESKIEKRIMDKLHQMDNTLSSIDEAVNNDKIEHQEDLQTSLTTLKTGQQKILTNFLVINELFDDGLNSTETKMSSVNRLLAELLAWQQTGQCDCKNLSQVVQQVYSSNGDLANDVKKYFSELHKVQADFTQLESYISNMSTKMLDSIDNALWKINATLIDRLNTISENVRPKYCRKGAVFESSHFVILPSTETIFSFPYLCEMITDGGGWIVIQRRTTGNVDFYRDWATYKQGFGSLDDDFWLGNDNIHTITSSGTYELRVDLKFQGKSAFAHYSKFSIDSEDKNYALKLGDYDGTAGDSLNSHIGEAFSTFDRDNDKHSLNCAEYFSGAWWYHHGCHHSNLNGKWKASDFKGPQWHEFSGSDPVSYSEMKIRELRDN